MVRWSEALEKTSFGTVTLEEGEGSRVGPEESPLMLPVLAVLPTLAGDGMGEKLCVCVCVCVCVCCVCVCVFP